MSNNAPDYENNLAFDPDINTMPRCDIEELKSQVKNLKDLLKECKPYISYSINKKKNLGWTPPEANILTKIDNAIGASKND